MLARVAKIEYGEVERRDPKTIRVWQDQDKALKAGAAALTYDVQEISLGTSLGASGGRRYYVKARWTVKGAMAYMLSAWIEPGEIPRLEHAQEAIGMRMAEFTHMQLDLDWLPKILNVFEGGGKAWILTANFGYESVGVSLEEHDGSGFKPTTVGFGHGC